MTTADVRNEAPIEKSFVPELSATFRAARLLLLLDTARREGRKISSIDRLAYYEFFADNPWIVIDGDRPSDDRDRDTLALAGFSPTQLAYTSTGPRFASRRERIRADLALLVALGLARFGTSSFDISASGTLIADGLQSSYADGFRASASVVLRHLVPLSNRALNEQAERWIGHSWLLLDLLDDVRGADVPHMTDIRRAR